MCNTLGSVWAAHRPHFQGMCISFGRLRDLSTGAVVGLLPYPPMYWKRSRTCGCHWPLWKAVELALCSPFGTLTTGARVLCWALLLGHFPEFHISSGLDVGLEISPELASFGEFSAIPSSQEDLSLMFYVNLGYTASSSTVGAI